MKYSKITKTKRRRLEKETILGDDVPVRWAVENKLRQFIWEKERNTLILILLLKQQKRENKFNKKEEPGPPNKRQNMSLQRNTLQ